MNELTINYTDLEAFEDTKAVFPTTYRSQLAFSLQQIIGYSEIKKVTAEASLIACLNFASKSVDRIKLLAAFYLIRTKNTMETRSLQSVKMELFDFKNKLSNNETIKKTQEDRAYTKEALLRKIFELEEELELIYQRYQVDPNSEVEAIIINADGSQTKI